MPATSLLNRAARRAPQFVALAACAAVSSAAFAAPTVSRLTPPSRPVVGFGSAGAVIARFLPDQRFDLQTTVQPDAGTTVQSVQFLVDNTAVVTVNAAGGNAANTSFVTAGLVTSVKANSAVVSTRAYSNGTPGVHALSVIATQSDGQTTRRDGVFEIVNVSGNLGRRARNVILLIGDGMGIAHRTAARIMARGVFGGKMNSPLAMDTFPYTGLVETSSLNSIVTDSAPGANCYSAGNKSNNGQEGVFPDDTTSRWDNPRVEFMGEYMFRKYGKTSGIVTTADVFDATPAAMAIHTQDRGAGTGIIDQYLNEAVRPDGSGYLKVLMGGGRRWFLPNGTVTPNTNVQPNYNLLGSNRVNGATSYSGTGGSPTIPSDIAAGWGVPTTGYDQSVNMIDKFTTGGAGFTYAPDRTALSSLPASTSKLLGLFHTGNMNIALDKIAKQRGQTVGLLGGKDAVTGAFVVDEYGFPNQPMLDEMTGKALQVLNQNPNGFTLMIEGASIDKQAHLMDSERWMLEVIEFDRAVKVAQDFANQNPDTLVIVTADHECAGVNIIGASTLPTGADDTTANTIRSRAKAGGVLGLRGDNLSSSPNLATTLVGTYEFAGFPQYTIAADGYPVTTDPDGKILIGYGANADRVENWLTNPVPTINAQDIIGVGTVAGNPTTGVIGYKDAPFTNSPFNPNEAGSPAATGRADGSPKAGGYNGFFITGQVPGNQAVHTASDIPLSAYGRGATLFTGVMDNTDVFFKMMQAMIGGAK